MNPIFFNRLELAIKRTIWFKMWDMAPSRDYPLKIVVEKIQEMYKFSLFYEVIQ